MPVRCLIVDDSPPFLEAAAALLEREGLEVVGLVSNSADALAKTKELRPDVVLVDIMLGPESGFDLARHLDAAGTDASVILISTHAQSDFEDLLDVTPSAGFVPKSELSAAVIERLASAPRDT